MKKGKIKKIDWNTYVTDKFTWPDEVSGAECGAYALHTITKKNYKRIQKLGKKGHWPTRVMMKYLKRHGFIVIPVTMGNVVYSRKTDGWWQKLNLLNVLLVEQECSNTDNTWSVIYRNCQAHSGGVDPLSPLEFINFPVAAAYLIFHKSWK